MNPSQATTNKHTINKTTNNMLIILNTSTKTEILLFLHHCCFSPVTTRPITKAVQNNCQNKVQHKRDTLIDNNKTQIKNNPTENSLHKSENPPKK